MFEHGTTNAYRYHKCRCDDCRKANADDQRALQRQYRNDARKWRALVARTGIADLDRLARKVTA